MDGIQVASGLTQAVVGCSTDKSAAGALTREIIEARTLLDPVVFWARFWARVEQLPNGCQVWTGAKNRWGYGILKFGLPRRNYLAHRIAFVYHGGELPAGADLLHGPCNNPACVRHTRPGDQVQNNRDTNARGRQRCSRTENNKRIGHEAAALARKLVAEGSTVASVARGFGVTPSSIHHILAGRSYRQASSVLR